MNIPTLDLVGMIDYYLEVLANKNLDFKPKKYPKPNLEIDILSTIDEWNTVMETGKGSMDDLDTTSERKREIDEILKETHKQYMNGEIKARPLKEFMEERKRKIQELKSVCDKGDD